MFKDKYILDNEYIKPDEQLLETLKFKMLEYSQTQEFNGTTPIAMGISDSMDFSARDEKIKGVLKSGYQKLLPPLGSIAACVLFIFFISKLLEPNNKLDNIVNSTAIRGAGQDSYTAEDELSVPEESNRKQDDVNSNDTIITSKESTALNKSLLSFDPQLIETISVAELDKDNGGPILLDNPDKIARIIDLLNTMLLISVTDNPEAIISDRSITLTFINGQTDTILINDSSLNYKNLWYSFDPSVLEQLNKLLES